MLTNRRKFLLPQLHYQIDISPKKTSRRLTNTISKLNVSEEKTYVQQACRQASTVPIVSAGSWWLLLCVVWSSLPTSWGQRTTRKLAQSRTNGSCIQTDHLICSFHTINSVNFFVSKDIRHQGSYRKLCVVFQTFPGKNAYFQNFSSWFLPPHASTKYIKKYLSWQNFLAFRWCLQCFDTVGWAAGRASGL